MNVTLEQLLALIGGKEVDLFLLRQEIAALKARIKELECSSSS